MNIRPINSNDNLHIAAVIRAVLTEHGVNKPGTVFTDPTTDKLHELFEKKGSKYFIAEENEKIIGGCGIYPTEGLEDGCVELVKLYLFKSYRKQGIGKNLMETSIQAALEMGYKQLYLETMPQLSNAVELYKSLGFVEIDHPLGDSGHFACDLWMVKKL